MNSKTIVVAIFVVLGAVFYLMWGSTNANVSAFGLNAFTEALGLLGTLCIVDVLMARHELLRTLPQRQTAYEDVRLLASRIISFWSKIYRLSVPEASPQTVKDLFSSDSFDKMMQCLDMESDAHMTPKRPWFVAFPQEIQDHIDRANTILHRHNNMLQPVAYRCVHSIATSVLDPKLVNAIRQSDGEIGCPRPSVLGSYFVLQPEYLASLLSLVQWCHSERKALLKHGVQGLSVVSDTIGPWERCEHPPSRISPESLARQTDAMQRFHRIT